MRGLLLFCSVLLALPATTASAAVVSLGWDNCVGNGGVQDRTFACDTNTGSHTFVASVTAPGGIGLWTSFETYIELQSDGAAIPSWWRFKSTGTCRTTSLVASADFTGAPYNAGVCLDSYAGAGAGGISSYVIVGNNATLKLTFAVPTANQIPLEADAEYMTARCTINNAKTVGATACPGCQDGVCLTLTLVRVLQPSGAPGGNMNVSAPSGRAHITWNSSVDLCYTEVPTKSMTWGSIKALYR